MTNASRWMESPHAPAARPGRRRDVALGLAGAALAAGALSSGCIGSVDGALSGRAPGTMESAFWRYEGADGSEVVTIEAYDFRGACQTWARWWEGYEAARSSAASDEELAATLTSLDEEVLPESFWSVVLRLAPAGGRTEAEGYAAVTGASNLGPGDFDLVVCARDERTDWAAVIAGDGTGHECWNSGGGTADVTGFDPGGEILVRGEADMLDAAGEPAGSVSFSLAVPACGAEAHGGE